MMLEFLSITLVEFLSTREPHDRRPGKSASCFFYSYNGSSYKYTNQPSRYTGRIGISQDTVTPARVLRPGADPREKEQLAQKISKADEIIANLQPEDDAAQAKIDEFMAQGQVISQEYKEAIRTKADWNTYESKLSVQEDKYEEAQENASQDNDKEKARKVSKIKKLMEASL